MRIGIDVGGTNTDAVLMDGDCVQAETKRPTTDDVTTGIVAALRSVLETGGIAAGNVDAVMIGTTHFTNAVVEGRRLVPVASIRLGLPATRSLPPLVDWPDRLRTAVAGETYLCHGGFEFDGREIAPLDRSEIQRVAADIAVRGLRAAAVASVYSPISAEFEERTAEILREEVPDLSVTLSSQLGRIGLLERENAAVMNASLSELASRITGAFRAALVQLGIDAPLYISQNDGTLMTAEHTERYPVATFASGPTNSMRGAALLSGESDCAVVDIGGTTADIGVLEQGFPREAKATVDIGGVRTNFRMPDVVSLGIGGGSLVQDTGGRVTVGPHSVGYELIRQALVFGGDVLTASDIAVAAGRASFGDASAVVRLAPDVVRRALRVIETSIAEGIDRMKTTAGDIPVVMVGGGSVLLGDVLAGASRLVRPDHFSVANAVGAAIAQVGGEVDQVFSIGALTRAQALELAREEAADRAVEAGARPDTVRIVDVEEVPIAYIPGDAVRIKVKAVGDLDYGRQRVAAHR
ncbi:MAG: hydantoinase/oxoprolinase family protein [Actinomycetota bacterium]